jgi:hypothetical protein
MAPVPAQSSNVVWEPKTPGLLPKFSAKVVTIKGAASAQYEQWARKLQLQYPHGEMRLINEHLLSMITLFMKGKPVLRSANANPYYQLAVDGFVLTLNTFKENGVQF